MTFGPAQAGPFLSTCLGFVWRERRASTNRRECRAEHRPGITGLPALHDHGDRIDLAGLKILEWDLPGLRCSVPIAELEPTSHDIVVGDRASPILASPDCNRDGLRNWAEPNLAGAPLAGGRIDRHAIVGDRKRYRERQGRSVLPALDDGTFDRALVAAENVQDSVHHDLRRVDLAVAPRARVGMLPLRMARQR